MKQHKGESYLLKRFLYPILFGLISGIVITLVVLLLLSVAASSFDIPPAAVIPLAVTANALGAFGCALIASKIGKRNGWLIGLVSSFVLFLLTTIAGFGLFSHVDGAFLIVKALIMLACGFVGGIVGVSTKRRRKR